MNIVGWYVLLTFGFSALAYAFYAGRGGREVTASYCVFAAIEMAIAFAAILIWGYQ